MYRDIRHVVAFSPVSNEPLAMIQKHRDGMEDARRALNAQGIGLSFLWADDGAAELPEDMPTIVQHPKNLHLATTLLDAYAAIVSGTRLKRRPDLVIRLDSQEHDPGMIPKIVDQMRYSTAQALFVPVVYWRDDEPRRLESDVGAIIYRLRNALHPVDTETIREIYNAVFPLGYQCFLTDLLEKILPDFARVMDLFEQETGAPPTWGMDLVSLVLAAHYAGAGGIDMSFGGWMPPWEANRLATKVADQRQKVGRMLQVLHKLEGLNFIHSTT